MDLVTSLKRLRRGALIAIQIVACGPSADPVTSVGTLVHECPVANSPTEPRALPLAPTHRAFGFGPDGQLLEFDTNTGRVVATAPTPAEFAGYHHPADIAYHAGSQRLWVVRADEDDQSAVVGHWHRGAHGFAPYHHRAWVDGRARLWPIDGGTMLFEEGYGERWRLLPDSGGPIPSVAAPRPLSLWATPTSGQERPGLVLHGFGLNNAATPPSLVKVTALVTPEALQQPSSDTVPVPFDSPIPDSRLAPSPSLQGELLVQTRAGWVEARLMQTSNATTFRLLKVGPHSRVEQIAMIELSGNGQQRVAILLSQPGQLVLADLQHHAISVKAIALPGEPASQDRFWGRRLLMVRPQRLLVSTDVGLTALKLPPVGSSMGILADDKFAGQQLRGPISLLTQ